MSKFDAIQSYAKYWVLGIIAIACVYELVAVFNNTPGDTVSATLWNFTQHRAWKIVIPFLWGVLSVHLFMVEGCTQWLLLGMGVGAGVALKKVDIIHR